MTIGCLPKSSTLLRFALGILSVAAVSSVAQRGWTQDPSTAAQDRPAEVKTGDESPPSKTDETEDKLAERAKREAAKKEEMEKKAREAARKRGEFTFDDLKFEIERDGEFQETMLTEELKNLNRKPMRLRGYILPNSVFQQSGIKSFVLVRDNKECCFGPGAMLYDCVMIEMMDGKTANFSTRPVSVKGTFEIDTKTYKYPNGGHFAVFRIKATEVK